MQRYLEQIFDDIANAIDHVKKAPSEGYDLCDWISEEEEERTAPIRNLQEWTGIYQCFPFILLPNHQAGLDLNKGWRTWLQPHQFFFNIRMRYLVI
jgi:hypothetical protein